MSERINEPESTGERFGRSVVKLGRHWRGERFSSVRVWPSALTEREVQDAAALLGEMETQTAQNWRSLPMFMPFNEAPPEEQERRRKRVRALRRPYDLAARVQQRTKWQPRLAARRERIT